MCVHRALRLYRRRKTLSREGGPLPPLPPIDRSRRRDMRVLAWLLSACMYDDDDDAATQATLRGVVRRLVRSDRDGKFVGIFLGIGGDLGLLEGYCEYFVERKCV